MFLYQGKLFNIDFYLREGAWESTINSSLIKASFDCGFTRKIKSNLLLINGIIFDFNIKKIVVKYAPRKMAVNKEIIDNYPEIKCRLSATILKRSLPESADFKYIWFEMDNSKVRNIKINAKAILEGKVEDMLYNISER